MPNILSIDVEEWWHLNYDSMGVRVEPLGESRVLANTESLLELLAECGAQATFFFLGSVAERFPGLVRAAQTAGHEIASHGYGHQLVYKQTRAEFQADVRRSVDILQTITGRPITGYRAPSWSISASTPWTYEVLAELGLNYSSSLFPFTTYLYGDSRASLAPFARRVGEQTIYEVPATVLELGPWRFPFGGGFYFRVMPPWITQLATRWTNRQGRAVVFYLHPREIDPGQPRLHLPLRDYFVSYVNLAKTARKLRRILKLGSTVSISRYLELYPPTPTHVKAVTETL
jgi:polysaccharide deacetylase family protein (PEP-CTERM system associated)